ncbi:MAG: hypothetical protein JW940_08130 [Polyangiaceae bacterium]|nr:hypothetical protein [Polyangiaceae bacterium]
MRPRPLLLALAFVLTRCTPSHSVSAPASNAEPPLPPLPVHVPSAESKCPTGSGRAYVDGMIVSSDGTRVMAKTRVGDAGIIELWDLASRKLVLKTPASAASGTFDFGEGLGSLITSFHDATTLFSLKDGAKIATIAGFVDAVSSGGERGFPNGNPVDHAAAQASLMAIGTPRAVEIRSTADGTVVRTFERQPDGIGEVHFLGDGLLVGELKRGSKVWRIESGETLMEVDAEITSASRSGKLLFAADGTSLRAWQLPGLTPLRPMTFEDSVLSVEADSADAILLVRTRKAAFQIPVSELENASDKTVVGAASGLWQAFPADAELTLSTRVSGTGFATPCEPDYVTDNGSLWVKVNPREVSALPCVACNAADGLTVWSAALDGEKVQAPSLVYMTTFGGYMTTFGGSSDGKMLVVAGPQSGTDGSEIWIYRLPAVAAIYDVNATAFGVAVTPDGSALAASFNDASIRVWSLAEGRFLGCLAIG